MLQVRRPNQKIIFSKLFAMLLILNTFLTVYAENLPANGTRSLIGVQEFKFPETLTNNQLTTISAIGQTPDNSSDKMPTSGSEIPYEPDKWNTDEIRLTTNCYAYAMNEMKSPLAPFEKFENTPDPGSISKKELREDFSNIVELVKADCESTGFSFKPADRDSPTAPGTYKVALVTATRKTSSPYSYPKDLESGIDYHWYRQNPDGTWSHKPGTTRVTNLDSDGKIILDPKMAARDLKTKAGKTVYSYNNFIGYFAVDSNHK